MARPRQTTPWLDQRNGIYYAFWTVSRVDPRGKSISETKRFSLRSRDRAEAEVRFGTFLVEGRSIYANSGGDAELTVARILDDYFQEHVQEKVKDKVRQENAIRHLKAFFKDDPVKSIDIPKCRAYAGARRRGDVATQRDNRGRKSLAGVDATIRRELVTLRAAVGHAIRMRRLTDLKSHEMPQFEYPRDRRDAEETGEAPWLTKTQFAALRAAAAKNVADLAQAALAATTKDDQARLRIRHEVARRLRDFIDIAYYTGSRRNAIETLEWRQVKFADNRIHLAKPGEQRTKKRRPVVPIDKELRPLMERLHAERENEWVLGSPNDLYRPFAQLCRSIGVDGSPHILRHSRVTHLLQDRVSIYDVARLIGDTVATTDRVYGHHSAEYLAEALDRAGKGE
jgi:integrase